MKRFYKITTQLIFVLSVFALTACTLEIQPEVDSSWELHLPGGETICSGGTPYAFQTRQTESDNLLIFFQPGGACLAGLPCDPQNGEMFDPSVAIADDPSTQTGTFWDYNDAPAELDGIFALDEERNPFADYNMVFVSYCTADSHLGNTVHNGVHHKGYINVASALDWTYTNIPNPRKIAILGSSAGGVAAPFYAGPIAENYTEAEIVVLSDSIGSFRVSVTKNFKSWGAIDVMQAEFGEASPSAEELNFESGYFVNGVRYPRISFAQFNPIRDAVQQNFLELMSADAPLAELLVANHADIHAVVDKFHTYTVDSSYHTILPKNRFYEESLDGVKFYEWVTDFVNGVKVPNVGP